MDRVSHNPAPGQQNDAPPSDATLRWVERCLGPGSTVKKVRPLGDGSSRRNHAMLVESRSGTAHRLVLRRWSQDWMLDNPGFSPEREIAALALLAGCEIPTPVLVAADPGGAYCDSPTLLITRLVGHPPRPAAEDLPEYLIQLAAALLAVHSLNGASTMPPYMPYNPLDGCEPPRHTLRPELWERAIDIVGDPSPDASLHFIHRDYHPDNTLWAYGRLTGIVDWSTASYGPIGIDIAHMRWNLALRYGVPAADRFLASFEQVHGGYDHHPYWDLRTLVDLLPEHVEGTIPERHVRLFENYLEGLLAQLGTVVR
ncbi:MAG TPA: aminoglycoside phosphotransferase family protein [Streptosporangiaceae bacterium]|nr:aminoglycoside phosphotransferase family protein [Streptosporangiaceae bacterium]